MSQSTPSDFDRVFKDLMSVVDKTRAAAEKSAKRGVGPRGPVSGGKEFVIPFVDKKQNDGKKKRKRSQAVRNKVPYGVWFNELRPRAGFLYRDLEDIPKKSAHAIRDRLGRLSADGRINISALDARLKETFDAATAIATREVLCPEMLIDRLIDELPWLAGLDTEVVGHCLDYFWRAREAYQEEHALNAYRPGGQSDPDSAQAVSRFAVATARWEILSGLSGLVNLGMRPFELPEDFALRRQWVDPESEESESGDSEDSDSSF